MNNLSIPSGRLYNRAMSRSLSIPTKLILIMLFGAVISKCFLNIFSNPPWQTADEPMFQEAILVTGSVWPETFFPVEGCSPEIQTKILNSLINHKFFPRLQLPEPDPVPATFRDTLFLRDAPSKLGREPLFYILMGLPITSFTDGILDGLFLARTLCALLSILGLVLLFKALNFVYPDDAHARLLPIAFISFPPAFWQHTASVNMESWKFFLVCLGIYLLTHPTLTCTPRRMALIFSMFLTAVLLTRWTLMPVCLVMILCAPHRTTQTRLPLNRKHRMMLLVMLLTIVAYSVLLFFRHEFNHASTGIINLATNPGQVFSKLPVLIDSFWTGFSWLQIQQSPGVLWLSRLVTGVVVILVALFIIRCKSSQFRQNNPLWKMTVFSISIVVLMVFIRSASAQSSVQGRYFFPVLPFIALALVPGDLKRISRSLVTAALVLILVLDICSNVMGWLPYQHAGFEQIDETVGQLSRSSWSNVSAIQAEIDVAEPASSSFLWKGWYPPEPGAGHRWMLNKAEVLLPLLIQQETILHLDLVTYTGNSDLNRVVTLYFNNSFICKRSISRTDCSMDVHIPGQLIQPGLNNLRLETGQGLSPLDQQISKDSRYLTIGLNKLKLFPAQLPDDQASTMNELPGWTVSPGKPLLQTKFATLNRDTFNPTWSQRTRSFLETYQRSINWLPPFIGNVTCHFAAWIIWIFLSIMCLILIVIKEYSNGLTAPY